MTELKCLYGGVYSSYDKTFQLYIGENKATVGLARWDLVAYPINASRHTDFYINNVKSISSHLNIPLANYKKLASLKSARIYDFKIFDTFTGKGYSSRLLEKIVEKINEDVDIVWTSIDEDNRAAIKACEKNGFIQAGHSINSLIMVTSKRANK